MDIRVTLVDLDGRSGPAILPDDVPVRRLLTAIVRKLKLATVADDGTLLLYGLYLPQGRFVADSLTLARAGIGDGAILALKVLRTSQTAFDAITEEDLDVEITILESAPQSSIIRSRPEERTSLPNDVPLWLKVLVVIGIFLCGGCYVLMQRTLLAVREEMADVIVETPTPTVTVKTAISSSFYNLDLTQVKGLVKPDNLLAFEGRVYLTAVNEETHSVELWRTNGTITNTRQISRFNEADRDIFGLVAVGERFFFLRDDSGFGTELWASDGSVQRTYLVKDIRPSGRGASPTELTVVEDLLFFSATDGEHGEELWRSDGTAAGTFMVADIHATGSARPGNLTAVGDQLFFTATDDNGYHQLWVSDGTASGTAMVYEIGSSEENIGNIQLATLDDTLYLFQLASQEIDDSELQDFSYPITSIVNDVEVTFQFKEIPRQKPNITNVMETENGLFYTTEDGALWFYSSDGEWRRLDNDEAGSFSQPRKLFAADDLLYFAATAERLGEELWRSDGTAMGTYMVKDIDPTGVSEPAPVAFVNGLFFFMADDGRFGRELWLTDGNEAGTLMVSNLTAGERGSSVDSLVELDGDVYFVQSGGGNGRRLWRLEWRP